MTIVGVFKDDDQLIVKLLPEIKKASLLNSYFISRIWRLKDQEEILVGVGKLSEVTMAFMVNVLMVMNLPSQGVFPATSKYLKFSRL
jgi:hypothetical protein